MIRAVFFDAGNTLFTERLPRAALYARAARLHGVATSDEALAAAMGAVHAGMPLVVDGGFRYTQPWFEEFIRRVFRRLGHPDLPPRVATELFAAFRSADTFAVFPDVVPALQTLAARGLVLGVVSNWTPHLPEILAGLGLLRWFATVVVSAEEGVEKPDPEIFRRAAQRAGVAAAEAAHVGDQPELDVAGARAAGFTAFLLRREPEWEPRGVEGALHVGSLLELPERLDGLR